MIALTELPWVGPTETAAALRGLQPNPSDSEVRETVARIIAEVRSGGDGAIAEIESRFGSQTDRIAVTPEEIEAALANISPELADALRLAAENVQAVAEAQLTDPLEVSLAQGQTVGVREVPLEAVGAYVPGGGGSYPSSVLMTVVPAKVAGVGRVAVATPAGASGRIPDAVLAACAVAGADEVYSVGGAQAIAMLAFGTSTVEPVDFICGPGNRYVQEAKRQLAGQVGFDAVAGPSELVVVVDGEIDEEWIALDLCAQAEHGADGLVAAISWDEGALQQVVTETMRIAGERDSNDESSLGAVLVPGPEEALSLVNALAPEHLELACSDADALAEEVRTAGCVFVGAHGATAFGDYVAGSNHVLPTGGSGRFVGPLGPGAFSRTLATVRITQAAARELAAPAATLAAAEGFDFHARSVRAREGRSREANDQAD